jgi:hypothetical protein
MKNPIKILVALLVVFAVVYFLLVHKEKKTFSPGRTENFLALDSAAVDRIEFSKFESKLVLRKVNDMWYMVEPDSHRADNNAVGRLLSLAGRLEVGEIISSNPQKQFWFQVDSLTGTGLDFFSGQEQLASLVIGKTSEDRMNGYLRKSNSDRVYLADVGFIGMAQRSVNEWRDRRIFTFDAQQIKEIESNYEGNRARLVRGDSLWQLSLYPYQETSQADAEAAERYVRTLADLRADDFPFKTQYQGIDFEKGQPVVKVTLGDDREIRLFAVPFTGGENKYLVKTDQDQSVFTLYEYNFKQLTIRPEDLQPKQKQ